MDDSPASIIHSKSTAQVNRDAGTDEFRIEIWAKATEASIDNNKMGASETADPSTAFGGGSIVNHK